ncbi:hypothetical protein PI124_g11158 [Phytophthora idaei]|nr:hypothetical protein PI125_g24406 [Phytophthora idaei]KAG3137800.1 hypothetical protein PI126_g17212 [Phytophthora idaei]KAG3137806.1 hypothetical protein PI126_g17205 [Phytophthora idaei]KAG3244053.1 hypothetical protein PI124_g11158 [Phytophthora idaei]
MRTSFLDWEAKHLVQIALELENEGIWVTWDYVARHMAKSKRTASQLRLRLTSLKRTYGKTVKNFPRCVFGGTAPGRCLLSSAAVRRKTEPSGSAVVWRKANAAAKQPGDAMAGLSASRWSRRTAQWRSSR